MPPYSPDLNRLQTLWRKFKCEWLKPHHFKDAETCNSAINDILRNIGNNHKIYPKKGRFLKCNKLL